MKKLYLGNLPFTATEDQIRDLLSQHGTVHSIALPTDRDTGRPRGFGFVEMDDDAADAVINALNGFDFGGRSLRIDLAKPRSSSGGGGGGGGGGGRGRW